MEEEAKKRRLNQMEKAAAALRPASLDTVRGQEDAKGPHGAMRLTAGALSGQDGASSDRVSRLEAKVEALEKVVRQQVPAASDAIDAAAVPQKAQPAAAPSEAPPPAADESWKEKLADMSGIRKRVFEKELRVFERERKEGTK